MPWGRIQDPVDPAPFEAIMLARSEGLSLGSPGRVSARVCLTMQEAHDEPYFFEVRSPRPTPSPRSAFATGFQSNKPTSGRRTRTRQRMRNVATRLGRSRGQARATADGVEDVRGVLDDILCAEEVDRLPQELQFVAAMLLAAAFVEAG